MGKRESMIKYYEDPDHRAKARNATIRAQGKEIMCVETGIVYASITLAAEAANIKANTIGRCIDNAKYTAGGYHWKSTGKKMHNAEQAARTKEILTRLYGKKVMCVETGKVYDSVANAARDMHISRPYISFCINGHTEHACGYHFKLVEK